MAKNDSENDDAIDGIVHLRKNKELTGEIIYVQVKSGSGYKKLTKKRPNHFGINLGIEHIQKHRPRWNALQGAVILVFVDDDDKAYWTDLKSDKSYTNESKSIVLISKSQRFGRHSKGQFKKIGDFFPQDRILQTIRITKADINYLRIDQTLKVSSREYYKKWSASDVKDRTNPGLGPVIINRVGWRHISRIGRGYDKVYQSWQLLCVAKKIIQQIPKAYQINKVEAPTENDNEYELKDFISLRAKVIFPNRHESVVQVILRRKRIMNKSTKSKFQTVWFYSVYEPRRGIRMQ